MPTVTGRVATPAGTPLAGVFVLAHQPGSPREREATHTGPDGRWVLALPDGAWTVRAHGRTHRLLLAGVDVDLDGAAATGEPPGVGEEDDTAALVRRLRERRRGSRS